MEIGSEQFQKLLVSGGKEMGISISRQETALLSRHARMLMTWNTKMNLTAIVDPLEVAIKHYLDALVPVAFIPQGANCLDIGTGGGFPGIPLKILRPLQPMTLIDSVRKKITFVKQAILDLRLEYIEAIHIRAQDLASDQSHQNRYSVVLCRALADLPTIIQLAQPFLAPYGKIIALKGPQEKQCSAEACAQSGILSPFLMETIDYRLPILGDRRSIVLITMS